MKYCCKSMENTLKKYGAIIFEDGQWEIRWEEYCSGDSWWEDREIFYCPFCGRKLGK